MTESLFILSHDELLALTGKRHKSTQVAALRAMGIKFILRPDGFPVVSHRHLDSLLGAPNRNELVEQPCRFCGNFPSGRLRQTREPNLAGLEQLFAEQKARQEARKRQAEEKAKKRISGKG